MTENTPETALNLGDVLKSRRDAAGLSQRELARRSGIGQSTISALESGAQTSADLPTLRALADKLNCSVADLTGNAADPHDLTGAPGIVAIPHNRLHRSDLNPRKSFDADALAGLAESIAGKGILENLVARPHPDRPDEFLVVAGERRWRAVGLLIDAGRLPTDTPLPVRIVETDDAGHVAFALIENLQREQQSPMDEARAFRTLIDTAGWTPQRIAEEIKRTDRHVQLRLALLDRLHQQVQDRLDTGTIALAMARVLTTVPSDLHPTILAEIDNPEMSLDTAERLTAHLRHNVIPASRAIFSLTEWAEYGHEIANDADGERWLYDFGNFADWQSQACENLFDELRETHAYVMTYGIADPFTPQPEAPADVPNEKIFAAIVLNRNTWEVTVHRRQMLYPVTNDASDVVDGDNPDTNDDDHPINANCGGVILPGTASSRTTDPLAHITMERRLDACRARSRHLQAAMMGNDRALRAGLILALLGDRTLVDIIAPVPMPENIVIEDPIADNMAWWANHLIRGTPAMADIDLFLPFDGSPYLRLRPDLAPEHIAILWRQIFELTAAEQEDLLNTLVTARVGTRFLPGRVNLGDMPVIIAVAAATGADTTATDAYPDRPECHFAPRSKVEAALIAKAGPPSDAEVAA